MRDFGRLRRQIWLALALAPLSAPGCTHEGASKKDDTVAVKLPADATVAQETPPPATIDASGVTAPPDDFHMPSCPSGNACMPAKDAKKVAQKDANTDLGCPQVLEKSPTPRPEGVPDYDSLYYSRDDAATKAKRDAGDKNTCCYTWVEPCPGGRPLLADDGAARVAPAQKGTGWGADLLGVDAAALPERIRARLARAWLEDALAEHASVASFARATLELMAVAAPPHLLAEHQRAGLDEIRHARICFELAARYAGGASAPGALAAAAPRAGGLPRLARDTFLEGCVGETIASLAVARAASGCTVADVAASLKRIAHDEQRHAALAWRTVAWALAEGGAPVAVALREAHTMARAAEPGPVRRMPPSYDDVLLASYGRLSHAAQLAVRADAWREIIEPTVVRLLAVRA